MSCLRNISEGTMPRKVGPLIIGVSGANGAGKDTLAEIISAVHKLPIQRLADALKDEYCKENHIQRCLLDNRACKVFHRDGLIELGQRRKYEQGPYYWCKKLNLQEDTIVSDVRFNEEVEYLINNSSMFYLFRVERSGYYDGALPSMVPHLTLNNNDTPSALWKDYCRNSPLVGRGETL